MEDEGAEKDTQERRSKRSLVLLAARIHVDGETTNVLLRNLSQNGALLEADAVPPVDTRLKFERGVTVAEARVAWASVGRFGIEFLTPIHASEVLVHLGRPKPAKPTPATFRLLKD